MRKNVLTYLFCLLAMSVSAQDSVQIPLIPHPQKYEVVSSQFVLSNATTIVLDMELADIAYYLQKELLRFENTTLPISYDSRQSYESSIILRIINQKSQELSNQEKESYSIVMNADQIVVEGSSKHGVFNGVSALIQLVRLTESVNGTYLLQCYNIEDEPAYEWRGMMLDESRHFFGKDKVKQLIDWMALYKLNRFHWHLTDSPGWRIEIKKYPKLAYVGGIGNQTNEYTAAQYYTQEDIKEVVRYAAERFIEVIPEIDMPGHARAANIAYPEYSGGGSKRYPEFTFNPGKEEVYQYLTDILREVDALFPFQAIHIGGDEVHFGNEKWETDEYVQALMQKEMLSDLKEVEEYFVKRMSDSLAMLNNKVAAWDEVIDYKLSKENTIIYYWRSRRPEQLQKSIDKEFPIVLCPNQVFYLDYKQDSTHVKGWQKYINSLSTIYNFTHLSLPVKYEENTNILGMQANIWTEIISTEERLDFMTFPRITALSETAWNKQDNKDFEEYNKRLEKHIDLYRKNDIYFFNPFNPEENREPMK